MSNATKALKEGSWLAVFKFFSQLVSWGVTIIIARILVPEDYGLMAMATVITGFIEMFKEFGLGAAIIQKKNPSENELSSVFWFILFLSIILSVSCIPISYLTAYIMEEERVIPLTQAVAILFIFSGLQIVPLNLIKKNLDFKDIGIIGMSSTIVSSCCMVIIGMLGGGVWTLVGGRIIAGFTSLILVYAKIKWRPMIHYNFREAKSYVKFGFIVSLSSSLFYVYENADIYFAGRAWPTKVLGYYYFALQLAKIPTEKIVSLINQISFPLLSIVNDNDKTFNHYYLSIVKLTATIVFPVYVGGYLLGESLIKLLLNENWYPIIFLFEYLCLAQILVALVAVNNRVHVAQGRPQWSLYFSAIRAIVMASSFYFAVNYGVNSILIPWFTTYLVIAVCWIMVTLWKLNIPKQSYLSSIKSPIVATLIMVFAIVICEYCLSALALESNTFLILILKLATGVLSYLGTLWLYDKEIFYLYNKLRA